MLMVATELRPSKIHGTGAFALNPIKKGKIVCHFDTRVDKVYWIWSAVLFVGTPLLQLPVVLQRLSPAVPVQVVVCARVALRKPNTTRHRISRCFWQEVNTLIVVFYFRFI